MNGTIISFIENPSQNTEPSTDLITMIIISTRLKRNQRRQETATQLISIVKTASLQPWPPHLLLRLLAPPYPLSLAQKPPPISLIHHHLVSASALFEYAPPALPPPRDPRHTLRHQHQHRLSTKFLGFKWVPRVQRSRLLIED